VKWYGSDEYYARSIKASWAVEGGGALINQAIVLVRPVRRTQAIHQVDVVLHLNGPVVETFGYWQLGGGG